MGPRIVLLTNNGFEGRALAQRLAQCGMPPALIVREGHVAPATYRWHSRLARKVVGDPLVDRLAALRAHEDDRATRAWETRMAARAHRWLVHACRERCLPDEWPQQCESLLASSVNTAEVLARIHAVSPDVLVVFGTRLLKEPLLSLAPYGALNGHSSLLPQYRGTRSEFWQCYNNDPDHIGISIHLVDRLVDTGPVLFKKPTRTHWPIDPFLLRAMNTASVLDHYPRAIEGYLTGALLPEQQGPVEARTYFDREHTMAVRTEMRKRFEPR
jgi:folate-dependent phosphoribosylglycinamide formyltransferase PurN